MSRRTDRVSDMLRKELAEILLREVSDPRASLASITSVSVSPDLRHARVAVSVLGSEEHRSDAVRALQHAAGYVRRLLGRRLDLRVTPELVFELDHGAEYSQQISDLLEGLHRDDEPT